MSMKLCISVWVCVSFIHSSVTATDQSSRVKDPDIGTLQQHLANSHHRPMCLLLRKTDSSLERRVRKLWSTEPPAKGIDFTSWEFHAVNISQVKVLPSYLLKNSERPKSALLRCFLGPILSYDFDSSPTTKQLQLWFQQLMLQHRHMVDSSAELIETSVSEHCFTLVVFPTAHQHEELEQAVYQVSQRLSDDCTINVIIIHPSSANFRDIREKYTIVKMPSVLLIEKDSVLKEQRTVYSIHDVMTDRMETDMRARLIPAHQLTTIDFESVVMKVTPGTHYTPYLVGFYAHWEKDSSVFLSFLRQTVQEFMALDADMRFGLVDAARNPDVVALFMSPACLQHLPFLALFHTVNGVTINKTELLEVRPTPYSVFTALREVGFTLIDSQRQPISYQPYGYNSQVCRWREGPLGDQCSASDNSTWLYPPDFLIDFLQYQHNQQIDGAAESDTIPLASHADWTSPEESLDNNGEMSVHIRIFIFIRLACKSCERSQATFQQVYQHLSTNDSYTVRQVNCTVTPDLCERHHVTGFPTILAFRWHRSEARCGVGCSGKGDCQQQVRQDYHGVLTASAILDWVRNVSTSSLHYLQFGQPEWLHKESVQLTATVVPLDSDYLPLPPQRKKSYFYSPHCFREVCERLFGLVTCFIVNSVQVPSSQFDKHSMELAIIQVVFRRRDGVEVTLMKLGQSLNELLNQETDHTLHMFHTHHSYNLPHKQKCEDDHVRCTLFLESFSRDHMRLPVIALTSAILHSHNDYLFGKKIPVLLALVEPDHSLDFQQVLENIAYTFYKDIIVATLDVSVFQAWAGSFVPRDYSKIHSESSSWGELNVYPRLCLFYWHDHTKAAFHPPVLATASDADPQHPHASDSSSTSHLSERSIAGFVQRFLTDPEACLINTERF